MANSKTNNEFNSPMDEVFAWKTPGSETNPSDVPVKRKCNDSGYMSPASGSKTKSTITLSTPEESNDTGFVSSESIGMYTPYPKSKMKFSKKRLLQSSVEGKCLNQLFHTPSVEEVDSYSEFLMETSLYTEPADETAASGTSMLDMIVEENTTEECLGPCEISKKIQVDQPMDISRDLATPLHSSLTTDRHYKTPITPFKVSLTSPRKKRQPLKKKFFRSRSLIGFEKIDILFQLGEKANYTPVVRRILDYLSDSDLSNVTMVSKTWRNICFNYPKAKARWLKYTDDRKERKENLHCSGGKSKRQMTPLFNVNHSTPLKTRQPSSPPVSPSKLRFHLFQKEARKLKPDEMLLTCPRCSLPSSCSPPSRLARCLRVGCAMEFCSSCRTEWHGPRSCPSSTPSTPPKRRGARESKRFLRRL